MIVFSIYNGKGGTCKTSVALNLGWFLSALGFTVVVVDCDGQANASSMLPYPYREPTLRHVITSGVPLHQAMYMARRNLYIVPSDPDLSEAVHHIGASKDWFLMQNRLDDLRSQIDCTPRPSPLRDLTSIRLKDLPTLEKPTHAQFHSAPDHIDFLFFDHVPNPDELTDVSLFASDEVLVPCELEKFAMDGIPRTLVSLQKLFTNWRRQITIRGIIPVNIDHSRITTPTFLSNLLVTCGPLVMREIHTDASVPNAQAFQEAVLEYHRNQRSRPSRAAREFFEIALGIGGFQGTSPDLIVCKTCAEIHQEARRQMQQSAQSPRH